MAILQNFLSINWETLHANQGLDGLLAVLLRAWWLKPLFAWRQMRWGPRRDERYSRFARYGRFGGFSIFSAARPFLISNS